jgi:ferric-dicitrate binding protein FerR (iron transport regulator)
MTESDDRLERLISRVLDREASSAERRELNRRTLADPRAAQLYEEYAALDREIGAALRSAMRPARRLFPGPLWRRIGQAGMLAVAACLALVIWMRPPLPSTRG